jgi:hypothetical protein
MEKGNGAGAAGMANGREAQQRRTHEGESGCFGPVQEEQNNFPFIQKKIQMA